MVSREFTAKKVDDAIKLGLEELGLTLDKVTVKVLDNGGFFRKAKVLITVDEPENEETPAVKPAAGGPAPQKQKPAAQGPAPAEQKEKPAEPVKPAAERKEEAAAPDNNEPRPNKAGRQQKQQKQSKKPRQDQSRPAQPQQKEPAKQEEHRRKLRPEDKAALEGSLEFIRQTVSKMGFENVKVEFDQNDPELIEITAPQGDDSLLIGRHGETLSALSYLAETGARAEKCHINVTVDCNGYRERRAASLSAMARRKAEECVRRRRKIKLEPMDRCDRRTIHSALNGDARVTTSSEGKEPYRCVVIFPAPRDKQPDKTREPDAPDDQE